MKTTTDDKHEGANSIHLTKILPDVTAFTVVDDYPAQANDNKHTIKNSKSRTNRKPVNIGQLFDNWDGKHYVAEEIDWGSPQGNEMW